jgi:hypothetical protein
MSQKQEIENQLEKLISLKGQNNWENIRTADGNFELREVDYPVLGKKKIYYPMENDNNENLQASRGIGIYSDDTYDSIINKVENEFYLNGSDYLQIADFQRIIENNKVTSQLGKNLKIGFCEIGFRIPKLLNFYKKSGYNRVLGYDINPFNVRVGKELGFECKQLDLNKIENELQYIDFENINHIACFHVLEHLYNPYLALKTIINNMKGGTWLHVEVPLEGEQSNLQIGHLFPFKQMDLQRLLQTLPVQVISSTIETSFGGDWNERHVVLKTQG